MSVKTVRFSVHPHLYWCHKMDLKTYIVMNVEPVPPEDLQKKSGRALTDWQDAQTRGNLNAIKALIENEVASSHPVEFTPDFFDAVLLVKTTESGAEAIKQLQGVGSVTIPATFKLSKNSNHGHRTLNRDGIR